MIKPVHPHARGEHKRDNLARWALSGSSPRPWGTQQSVLCGSRCSRFIPTPVGNTSASWSDRPDRAVHPHARGEHGGEHRGLGCHRGSSPRPWGTRGARFAVRAARRFIPTPVGNTRSPRCTRCCATVHPHARGEHLRTKARAGRFGGSSPRPWGTRASGHQRIGAARFIPTPVGNTTAVPSPSNSRTVHPHARGEHG